MATNESSKKETLPELVKKMAQNVSCLYCWQSKPSKSSSEELESLPPSNRSATHNPFPEFSTPAQYGSESDEKSQRVEKKLPGKSKHRSVEKLTSYTLATFCSQHTYNNYNEMWEDVKRWISPLRNHPGLHSEFLSYATKKFKNLEDLMTKLQGCLDALDYLSVDEDIVSIIQNLSVDTKTRKDQIKVMIILSDVFIKFPSHIVEHFATTSNLTQEIRESLIKVITQIPYDEDSYSFRDDDDMSALTAFMNSNLQLIMKKIGFSKPQGLDSGVKWTAQGNFHLLAGGFFFIWGTFCTRLHVAKS